MSEPLASVVPTADEAPDGANGFEAEAGDVVEVGKEAEAENGAIGGEESDDYDDVDDEDEKQIGGDEEEEEYGEPQGGQKGNSLTALLLGDHTVGEQVEEEEEEDQDDDDDDDDEYVEDDEDGHDAPVPATPSSKKRGIDEVTEEADQVVEEKETKKAKA